MARAQATVEFLASFLFYLAFLSAILLALSQYSLTVKQASSQYSAVAGMEGDAVSFESFQIIRRFSLFRMDEDRYRYEQGSIILREDGNVAVDIVDAGGMEYEPV